MERVLPLNAVRVFVEVGRLLSFSRAADELHVTASAVSHQIKALEDHLGISLLRRESNHIALTAEGKIYWQEASESMLRLSHATRKLITTKDRRVLRMSAPPSLSALWLMPRINRFRKLHPQIAMALTATQMSAGVWREQYDIAIWYCQGRLSGFRMDELSPNESFPICNPRILDTHGSLRKPSDLRDYTLLDSTDETYYRGPNAGWHGWLQAAGVPDITGMNYLSFTPRALMHQAVFDGLGVGLSRTLLAADSLATGQLACPFGPVLPLGYSYYLVCPEFAADRADIVAFRDWVLEEVRATRAQTTLPD